MYRSTRTPIFTGNPMRTRSSAETRVLNLSLTHAQFAIIVPSLGCLATYVIPCLWVSHSLTPLTLTLTVTLTLTLTRTRTQPLSESLTLAPNP